MRRLTDKAIQAAKPQEKPYKLSDSGGLALLVTPEGGRWWRLRYRYGGREKMLSLGIYPDVTLRVARERRDDARKALNAGIDPSAQRKATTVAVADSFEAVAREFLEKQRHKLEVSTLKRDTDQLENFVFPYLGDKPVAAVEAPDLLDVLRKIEAKGNHDTAHRVRALCGRVFRYAIATGRTRRDIAADLKGALVPHSARNHPAITDPAKVGQLLRAIDGFDGQPATVAALKLAPYVFLRPGELRGAEWSEFDLNGGEWRIPAERMKMREQHIVPLATQAVTILRELKLLTGRGKLVFPAIGNSERPISENTLNAALRRLGYSGDEHVAHGFRSMASSLLNERGVNPDLIELQLAHKERNKVRAAYNRAQRLDERRKMMQTWADYLDGLRSSKS